MRKNHFSFWDCYACLPFIPAQKNVVAGPDQAKAGDVSAMKSAPVLAADIFDPSGLVSPGSQGQLSVLGFWIFFYGRSCCR
jgi:hypothetical protein